MPGKGFPSKLAAHHDYVMARIPLGDGGGPHKRNGIRALAREFGVDKRTVQRYRAKHQPLAERPMPFSKFDMDNLTEADFRLFVDFLFQSKRDGTEGFLHAAVGLAGESAEVLDHMKKMWVYDRPMDREKVLEEMGDTIHYLMMLCIKMDVTFADLIKDNVIKLRKRYPDGFTKQAAIARADKAGLDGVEARDNETYAQGQVDPGCCPGN